MSRMTTGRRVMPALLVWLCMLAGCASGAFKPTEVNAFGTPYEGLNESSYGPRSTVQFRYCDPQDDYANNPNLTPEGRTKMAEFTHSVAAGVGSALGAPIQGLTKIDASIVDLKLQDYFKVPSDSNHPTVAVLSSASDGIVFWHSAKLVRLSEVKVAAEAYCGSKRRTLLYRGSATRCPPLERGLAGQSIIHTYAISAFACTARP